MKWNYGNDGRCFCNDRARQLTPAGYLALHLALGAFLILFFSWSFGAVAANVAGHRPLLAFDHKISFWLQEHSTQSLINVAANLSYLGSASVLAIASFTTGLFLLWKHSWDRLLLLILAMGGGAALCLLLRIFHWSLPLPENPLAALPSETFPSWHAMGSTLLYGLLAAFAGTTLTALRWRALAFLAASVVVLLIALTRIYLGAHYVTDVGGAVAPRVSDWRCTDAPKRECRNAQRRVGVRINFHGPISTLPLPLPLPLLSYLTGLTRARLRGSGRGRIFTVFFTSRTAPELR
jgi:membrane-associated phospholipid phosphatase